MARRRTPILYLAPWIDLGGSDKGTIDWFKHIDRDRWAPSILTTQPSSNRWLHHVEPYAEEVWDLPDLLGGDAFPAFILGFIESRGIEIVHVMNSRIGFDLLPDMTALPHPPAVVVQLHAEEPDRSGYVRYVTTRYGNLVDSFSVVSRDLAGAMTDYDIPPSRIETIYLGVDAQEEFDPDRVEPLPLDDGVPRILWPGRLVEQKDPLLTLDVVAAVRDRGTEFVLDLVGDGHLAPRIRERAAELGVEDRIRWHPPSQEMARWYRSADIVLMTSVFEGVPLVIYEALAMGVPVVAPALPGTLELMDDRCGATIAPRDDVGAYADAIVALLGDEERRAALGAHARARMLSDFSLQQMGSQHDALYERLLTARAGALERRAVAMRPAIGETPADDPAPAEQRDGPAPLPEQIGFDRTTAPSRTVGVVVPCHRHGLFLEGCVESVKRQTLAPAAIVVVDDASRDPETVEALARLDGDPDVVVLRQPENSGPSAARNRAIATLDTSYVLPLDADDELMPDALERMVAAIEGAPDDVGYIYPNAQHIGNRADYVPSPAYNLWLLMCNNYVPAPALFDRRIFEAGIGYPEQVVYGHEDWDLILDLGAHGVHGRNIDGPTFLYRRRGFSRVNAVEYGPQSFHHAVELRHPSLFDRGDEIKRRWAPAISVVLADDSASQWQPSDLAGRPEQAFPDFELIAPRALADHVRVVDGDDGSAAAWLGAALAEARGRWVVVLSPPAAAALRRPGLLDLLLRGVYADPDTTCVVLGAKDGLTRASFSQLTADERLDAWPVGVIFERDLEQPTPAVPLASDEVVASLVFQLQAFGRTQWRLAPGPGPTRGADHDLARVASDTAPAVEVALDRELPPGRAERSALHAVRSQPPRLPGLEPGTIRRWEGAAAWIPPETVPLCRHRAIDGDERIVTNSREPREGFVLEFDLGAVHRFAVPGTVRLVDEDETFALTDDQGDLGEDRAALGYLEQAPFPLLELVELRRLPSTGQAVLVAGKDDPLYSATDAGVGLGWIEPLPIHPRHPVYHGGAWAIEALHRFADLDAWRHRYKVGPIAGEDDPVALGGLMPGPGPELVELRLRADGRLETDATGPSAGRRNPIAAARWVAAPLSWSNGLPPSWARRAAGSRALHLVPRGGSANGSSNGAVAAASAIGWLRRGPAPGFSPLVSSTHPATGDQFVTRSKIEAGDLGYEIDGVLGYIFDAGADRDAEALPRSILWGSHFGKGRRYVEEGSK